MKNLASVVVIVALILVLALNVFATWQPSRERIEQNQIKRIVNACQKYKRYRISSTRVINCDVLQVANSVEI